MTITRHRLGAALAALCLPASLLALTSQPASAAKIGNMQLVPATGNGNTNVVGETDAGCPVGTEFWTVEMSGTGIAANMGLINGMNSFTPGVVPQPNASGGYSVTFTGDFEDVFLRNNIQQPSGVYTVSLVCFADDAFTSLGELNASIQVTPTATNYVPTYVQLSNGVATTTTLVAAPLDPVAAGTVSTLTATISPAGAVGAVQFKQGATNLGAPVAVAGGSAAWNGTLAAGAANLTAVFVPTNPNNFQGSTSAATPYVVVSAPSITGTVKVGATVTCTTSVGGTQTFTWQKAGVDVAGLTTKAIVVPASLYKASLTCAVNVSRAGRNLTRTSAPKTVAIGAALRNTTKPVASGIAKVGKVLTCSKGAWSPTASSYSYKWLRDGRVITGKTARTYTLVRADRTHKVGCQVTAKKFGYTNGVAKSAARLIG